MWCQECTKNPHHISRCVQITLCVRSIWRHCWIFVHFQNPLYEWVLSVKLSDIRYSPFMSYSVYFLMMQEFHKKFAQVKCSHRWFANWIIKKNTFNWNLTKNTSLCHPLRDYNSISKWLLPSVSHFDVEFAFISLFIEM